MSCFRGMKNELGQWGLWNTCMERWAGPGGPQFFATYNEMSKYWANESMGKIQLGDRDSETG